MSGTEVTVPWRGRTVRAWLPDALGNRSLELSPIAIRKTERARQTLVAADLHMPRQWEPLARLLLRAEGVASSFIEGVRAPVAAVAAAEADPAAAGDTAAWIAANLAVLDAALDHAHGDARLTVTDLHRWHADLMAGHSALPDALLGAFRDSQGWIGGTSPLDASLVTAPADHVPALIDDLLGWFNRTDPDTDPVSQAAVGHAQFEIIHPYGDGNGRLGRILILWVLARRLGSRVLPPLSTRLAADTGGYLSGLTLFRTGSADAWIRWFADTLTDSAAAVSDTMTDLDRLATRWRRRVDQAGIRSDATARRLLEHLPAHPVLTPALAAALVGTSERAARSAVAALAAHDILQPIDAHNLAVPRRPGRPQHWWVAADITALIAARR